MHNSCTETSPRGGAPKSFPVERSPVRDNFPGPVRSERRSEEERGVRTDYAVEAKRREARRKDRSGAAAPR